MLQIFDGECAQSWDKFIPKSRTVCLIPIVTGAFSLKSSSLDLMVAPEKIQKLLCKTLYLSTR